MDKQDRSLKTMLISAMFLALAIALPFLTGQIKELGNMLCPMHLPIMLCGFICGSWYGMLVGFIAPLFRSMLFGMPMIIPSGIAMAFELATYGFITGFLYKRRINIYIDLLLAMILGRIVSVAIRLLLYGLGKAEFAWAVIIANTFTKSILGIILQLILIPMLIAGINKRKNEIN